MNKEELINKITEAEKDAQMSLNTIIIVKDKDGEYERGFRNAFREALTLVKKLDEPNKVIVPRFVDEWIKQCKKKATLADCLYGYYETSNRKVFSSEDFQNWFLDNENEELAAKAWLFGYEVEPEPTWVVKFADSRGWYFYFTKWSSQNDPELPVISPCGITAKDDAYKFMDKSKAEALAVLIDGTVEDV